MYLSLLLFYGKCPSRNCNPVYVCVARMHMNKTDLFFSPRKDNRVSRLRKWLVARLISIVENQGVKKEEDLVMDVARLDGLAGFV